MSLRQYLAKMKGTAKAPPGAGAGELLWSWIGSVIGIGVCGWLSARYFEPRDLTLLIGSFGASRSWCTVRSRAPWRSRATSSEDT